MAAELVACHEVDVVVLVECGTEPNGVLGQINATNGGGFHYARGLNERIRIFTRFSPELMQPAFESDRVTVRRLSLPARSPILLAAVHLPSKFNWATESQPFECMELARIIGEVEAGVGHRRTILVDDFNMNPFESGLVGAAGLNAVMSREVVSRGARTVQGREYPFFYNPMWAHFGDARGATAGSYFYDTAEHVNYFWNMFDQVLLRPELASNFDPSRLSIVTAAGNTSLVQPNGRPNHVGCSDHLPLVFEVEF